MAINVYTNVYALGWYHLFQVSGGNADIAEIIFIMYTEFPIHDGMCIRYMWYNYNLISILLSLIRMQLECKIYIFQL